MGNKNTLLKFVINALFEASEEFWIVGAISTCLFYLSGLKALEWVIKTTTEKNSNWIVEAFYGGFGNFLYIFPASLFLLAVIFAWRSINTYLNQYS